MPRLCIVWCEEKKTEINDSRVDGGFQFACCLFSIDGAMYDSAAAAPAEISNVLSMQQKKKKMKNKTCWMTKKI